MMKSEKKLLQQQLLQPEQPGLPYAFFLSCPASLLL
jgi:hypothetical protein